MSVLKAPENTPVWVNYDRCKACDICVSVCPAGVLAMVEASNTVLGKTVKVVNDESCIGCMACELSCPDVAINVAEKSEFKFAKLTSDAKERAVEIRQNKFMILERQK